MNKGIFAILFVVAVLSISFPVNAQKTAQRVGEGYTSEGIYYEVYVAEDLAENDIVLCGASVSVTREVIYSGVVKPQTEISWREKINGSYYSGVLTISKYSLAYFASGHALKPLRDFAAQVERVQPDNLSEIRLSEDVPTELQRCSASFNDMIARLGEGFSAQRQFTGNAAHELRTPLALMQAQIELFISEHSGLQPETAELLGLLQEQTERMSRMTKVLLEMSELRSVPCEDDMELGPLSEEVLTDLVPLAENKGIALNCAGDALAIGSDTLLYRLVFNLVENAIRYSRPGSTVNVSICDNNSHVLLRVEDQGPGIPKQHRESIFQPFFRLDKSRRVRRCGLTANWLPTC